MSLDVLFWILAAVAALVVYIVCDRFFRPSSVSEKDQQVLFEAILQRLSFEWKFVEEIAEEIFADADEELLATARTYLGDMSVSRYYQTALVNSVLEYFCEVGLTECEEVLFSKKLVQAWPHLFKPLPKWKHEECEMELEAKAIYGHEDEEIQLRRYRKKPTGRPKEDPPHKLSSWLGNGLAPA